MPAKLTPYDRAIRAAAKKLPFKSLKQQNELLEIAADDLALRLFGTNPISVGEIIRRLMELKARGEG